MFIRDRRRVRAPSPSPSPSPFSSTTTTTTTVTHLKVSQSHDYTFLAVGDKNLGSLSLFPWPCLRGATGQKSEGSHSKLKEILFSQDDLFLLSLSLSPPSLFLWRVVSLPSSSEDV
eukprot:TRINITY_DN1911_c0_g7_i1.p2 TRINITY_DN1911_c0_g7~~TRINITY_DN1911_c0_g7_i1.p2  ORF type:complete len:116 (+),score=62.06 TRINITY_DN1911_c0_g7_i1:2-349(+)